MSLSACIDHTWLPEESLFGSIEQTAQQLTTLVAEATQHGFAAVCVRPEHAAKTRALLGNDSPVKLAVVIGFPSHKVQLDDERWSPTIGNVPMEVRLAEIQQAKAAKASELDVVLDVFAFQTAVGLNQAESLLSWFEEQKAAAGEMPIKLIIETDILTPEQMDAATLLCAKAGMAMVKTSTGYVQGGKGATAENIQRIAYQLERYHQDYPDEPRLGIKASGGVRTPDDAKRMIDAGAKRIGTSNGVALLHCDTQGAIADY